MNIRYRSRISTTSKGKDRKKSTVSKASRNSVSSAGGLANSRLSDHSELPCEDDAHCKSRESWGGGSQLTGKCGIGGGYLLVLPC